MAMGYAYNLFVKIMDWIYSWYIKITTRDLMKNQDTMQAAYHVKYPIKFIFNQITMVQKLAIAVNSPFSNRQFTEMGIAQILDIQEYTHAYRMWKIIASNERTWVHFKAHLQKIYLIQEELDQTAGAAVLILLLLVYNLIIVYRLIVISLSYVETFAPVAQSSVFKLRTVIALK